MSYYRQTVLDIAMGMLTGKFGWATHLGSRARQIVVVFGSCEISDETTKVKIEQGYSMSARTKRPSWNAWKVGLKKKLTLVNGMPRLLALTVLFAQDDMDTVELA